LSDCAEKSGIGWAPFQDREVLNASPLIPDLFGGGKEATFCIGEIAAYSGDVGR